MPKIRKGIIKVILRQNILEETFQFLQMGNSVGFKVNLFPRIEINLINKCWLHPKYRIELGLSLIISHAHALSQLFHSMMKIRASGFVASGLSEVTTKSK
jgi:hypothetical protein